MGLLKGRLGAGTRRIAYFVLPAAVALATLSPQVIGALFQTGAFGATQTAIAAGVLSAYAIGIPAQASLKLFASGHYARGDTKTPVRIGVLSVVVSAVSAYLLMQRFGPAGIALGAAIAAWVNASLNFGTLSRRVGRILDASERKAIAASVVSTVPAALAGLGVARALAARPLWLSAVAALAAFSTVYGVLTLLLRHPEAQRVWSSIRHR
jgi:putative peptidoglycan lipid II flippase